MPQQDPFAAYVVKSAATDDPFAAFAVTPEALPKDDRGYLEQVVDRFTSGLSRAVKDPAVGAGLAGAVAAPFTGGMSLLGSAAAMGAAGAAGAAPSAIAKGDPLAAAKEGAMMAAGQGLIGSVGKLLTGAGKFAYRTALAPTQQVLTKYPNVVTEGLAQKIPVSAEGVEKAAALKRGRLTMKQDALTGADERVGYRVPELVTRTQAAVDPHARAATKAGLPNSAPSFDKRAQQVLDSNPGGWKPTEAEEIKRTLDDQLGGAFRKVAKREPVTPRERFSMAMSKQIGDAQAESVPGYRDMNRSIMDAAGLESAIARRTGGSGGNQILDTLLMATMGGAGIPARVGMMPPVLSRAGIRAHQAGGGTQAASPYLAALMALLSPNAPEDKQ